MNSTPETIGIIGGGPSGLFMLKALLENSTENRKIHIFEKKKKLGAGMPYSHEGAEREHITNVSANEIPELVTSVNQWLESVPEEILQSYNINKHHFNEYKVLPRLLFGDYLEAQFQLLIEAAERAGIHLEIHTGEAVADITVEKKQAIAISTASGEKFLVDKVVICTGHNWPIHHEGTVNGWFDSPYPPKKLQIQTNHPVAIKGSSLTAIDAIRTLARQNGTFSDQNGKLVYQLKKESQNFRLVMHSRSGMLPSVRFHLEESHLKNQKGLTEAEIEKHIAENEGFLSLDFLFEHNFKRLLLEHDAERYGQIKKMDLEQFTQMIMGYREEMQPFELLAKEYQNAEISIAKKKSIYWKELLAMLSFALNYPAKHLSAEDMLRLQKLLMPLISIIIAFVPQASAKEMLALHKAGVLQIVPVGENSDVKPVKTGGANYFFTDEIGQEQTVFFETFVDCVGQPHLNLENFPFQGLQKMLSPATLPFRSQKNGKEESRNNKKVENINGLYQLNVPGIRINDHFQVIDREEKVAEQVFVMAVPYIGGYNPDYSGLDFCEEASSRIANELMEQNRKTRMDLY